MLKVVKILPMLRTDPLWLSLLEFLLIACSLPTFPVSTVPVRGLLTLDRCNLSLLEIRRRRWFTIPTPFNRIPVVTLRNRVTLVVVLFKLDRSLRTCRLLSVFLLKVGVEQPVHEAAAVNTQAHFVQLFIRIMMVVMSRSTM